MTEMTLEQEAFVQQQKILVEQAAKKLADNLLVDMRNVLTDMGITKDSDEGVFQAQVCQLLSSFILCHTIKILQMKKIPQELIDAVCFQTIDTARGFAKEGKFTEVKEH